MNDATPLSPEQIDLLLSADLDGEFDAAAADLRLEPSEARALLESVPRVDERRADLMAARDLLGHPVEIDDLLAARLRAKALKAGADAAEEDRRAAKARRTRRLGIVSGIAAALVVVVALGASLNMGSNDDSTNSAGDASSESATLPTTDRAGQSPVASGGTETKRLRVESEYASVEDLAADVLQGTVRSANGMESELFDASSRMSASPSPFQKCGPVARRMEAGDQEQYAAATTRVDGESVSILVYEGADGRTVYIFDQDCKLVTRQRVR